MTAMQTLDQHIAIGFLAGGQARRMGGKIKPLIAIDGKTILARQLETLSPYRHKLLNINANKDRFAAFDLPLIFDDIDGFAGPLAGILACLDYLAEYCPNISHLVSIATDAPFITADLPARLYQAIDNDEYDIAHASSYGRTHPVFAIWAVHLRADLRHALTHESIHKIDAFTARYRLAVVDFEGRPDPFMNINRPDDIEQANQLVI